MRSILSKIFIQRYYIQNTGFFLVIFYLFFGVVNGDSLINYHLSLMEGFLGNYGFLAAVLLLWCIYGLKCAGFVLKTFQLQEFSFLYPTLGSVPGPARHRAWLFLHAGIYLPVLIYAAIAAGVGISRHYYLSSFIIVVFNLAMCCWPLPVYERKLHHPDVYFFTGSLQNLINRHFVKHPVLYFPYELVINFPRRLFIIKLVSAGILWLTFYLLSQTGAFDLRGLQIGTMLCVLAHLQLILHHRTFDDTYLGFLRQLPVSLFVHYLRTAGVYCLLFLPEMIMIIVRVRSFDLLTIFATQLSLLILFRCLLYFPRLHPELFVRYVLIISFAELFLILSWYQWPAILILQGAAGIIFFTRYRKYERAALPE